MFVLSLLQDIDEENKSVKTVEGCFDRTGGTLIIQHYGCTMYIPKGALEEGGKQRISFQVLTNVPDDLVLLEDEIMVSCGFHCSPSGLHFKKPIQISMPHSAKLHDAEQVDAVVYWKSTEGKNNMYYVLVMHHIYLALYIILIKVAYYTFECSKASR